MVYWIGKTDNLFNKLAEACTWPISTHGILKHLTPQLCAHQKEHCAACTTSIFLGVRQKWTRIRTGSDWIRTEANFGWITTEANFGGTRTGPDCNFFQIGGSGLHRTEKIFVVLM